MQQFIELTKGTGKRQKCLLLELEKQAIICLNRETGFWMRGALSCRLAKGLLLSTDKTIQEQIDDLELHVLRLEKEAESIGVKLGGHARKRLNELCEKNYNKKEERYEHTATGPDGKEYLIVGK